MGMAAVPLPSGKAGSGFSPVKSLRWHVWKSFV